MKKYDEYKESGFGWIGEVPSLWNNLRLRFVCEFRNGYTPSKANPEFWEDGSIPWYRMEDIRETGRKLNEAKQYITKEAVKVVAYLRLAALYWRLQPLSASTLC